MREARASQKDFKEVLRRQRCDPHTCPAGARAGARRKDHILRPSQVLAKRNWAALGEALQRRHRGGNCVEEHHQGVPHARGTSKNIALQGGARGGAGDEFCGEQRREPLSTIGAVKWASSERECALQVCSPPAREGAARGLIGRPVRAAEARNYWCAGSVCGVSSCFTEEVCSGLRCEANIHFPDS